jgi:hypothetical protein
MNHDVEDLLREGMERFTRDLRAPAGLTRRVARRRRRRLALRSAAGAAAALAAGAVALVAVVVPGARDSARDNSADATAYVVERVDGALSVAEPGEIAQMTVTTRSAVMPGGTIVTTTAEEWSHGSQWRSVKYSPAGQPAYDEGSGTSSPYTLVSYLTRTWARQRLPSFPVAGSRAPAFGPRGCGSAYAGAPFVFQSGLPGIGFSARSLPTTVASDLRTAISCGTLARSGRQSVDGIEAVRLTSRPGSPIIETIWVSPGTYLPVRVVIRSAGPHSGLIIGDQRILRQTADITWLPPTAQNLAKLTVPIPAGFRHVPLPDAATPTLPRTPGTGPALPSSPPAGPPA